MTGVGVTLGGGGFGVGLGFVGVGVGVGMIAGAATAGDGRGVTTATLGEGGGGSVQMSTAVGVGAIDGVGRPTVGVGDGVGGGMGVAGAVGHDCPSVKPIPASPTWSPPGQASIVITGFAGFEDDGAPEDAAADSASPSGSAAAAAQTPNTAIVLRPAPIRLGRRPRGADVSRRRMYLLLPVRTLGSVPLIAHPASGSRPSSRRDQFAPGAARNWLIGVESAWITPW
jgi:hypothetical protein